jgi:hypothetical protein
MTIQEVMQQERAGLLSESMIEDRISHLTLLPYAAVTDPEVVVRTPTFLRAMYPVVLESLPGQERDLAFIQVCAKLKYKYLWVHADNGAYRADYATFLREVHKVSEQLPESIHVDHLYNRQRAKILKTPYIRLVLTAQPINTSHGAGYERSRTSSALGRAGRDHKMDEILLMKLCGVPSPRKGQPLTAEMLAHVNRIAELSGMDVKEIARSIKDLMEVAAF